MLKVPLNPNSINQSIVPDTFKIKVTRCWKPDIHVNGVKRGNRWYFAPSESRFCLILCAFPDLMPYPAPTDTVNSCPVTQFNVCIVELHQVHEDAVLLLGICVCGTVCHRIYATKNSVFGASGAC